MSNEYYTPSGAPGQNASLASAAIRSEFQSIANAFAKLPDLAANAGLLVAVNGAGTALEAIEAISVAQGGTGVSSLTANGLLLGGGTAAISAMARLGLNEVPVGQSTGAPIAMSGATLRSAIGLGTSDSPTFAGLTLGSPLPVAQGGTGVAAFTASRYFHSTAGGALEFITAAAVLADIGGAAASVAVTAGTGLTGGGTLAANFSIALDTSNSRNVDHSSVSITAGTGLSGGGTIAASRSLALDISGLTAMTAAPVGTDGFLIDDGGTMKRMSFNQAALPSRSTGTSGNFASTDIGTVVYWTGASGTLTMGASIGQDNGYIIVVNSGSGDLTIAGSGVTITSAYSLVKLAAGAVGVLIRESSTVWFLGGILS